LKANGKKKAKGSGKKNGWKVRGKMQGHEPEGVLFQNKNEKDEGAI